MHSMASQIDISQSFPLRDCGKGNAVQTDGTRRKMWKFHRKNHTLVIQKAGRLVFIALFTARSERISLSI